MKLVICLALFVFSFSVSVSAQDAPLWLRYPAISPDGRTVLFEYKGDIWSVPAAGGDAGAAGDAEGEGASLPAFLTGDGEIPDAGGDADRTEAAAA